MKIIRIVLATAAMSLVCGQAAAIDFQAGAGIQGQFRGTLTWGTQVRTESPSPEVYADWPSRAVPGTARGILQGQTGGSDLNFGRGDPVSTVLKAVFDLELQKDHVGLFLRGRAWHDLVLGDKQVPYGHYPNGFQPHQPLNDRGFEASARFSHVEWRDAYLHGRFKGGKDKTLDLRWGRQVLPWGTSTLHSGGVRAAIHPLDMPSQLRPSAMPFENQLPLGMLSGKWNAGSLWRVEGFAAYEARGQVLPGCGTFFDVLSFAPKGCDFAALAGATEQALAASGNYVHRNPDVTASKAGQYGISLAYRVEPWGADVQAFALNTHSTTPNLRMTVNTTTPGVRSVNYAMVYPEDVALVGLGFRQKIAPTTRMSGGLIYRPRQPVTLNAHDVLAGFISRSPTSVLALNKGITALPVGGTFDAYDRFGVLTGSWGVDTVFPKTLGADRVVWLAELGFSQVRGLPDTSILRYGRPLSYGGAAYIGGLACVDAVPGKTCTREGYVSPRAWGVKMVASATYANAPGDVTWTPSVLVSRDVRGYSHDGAFSEGRRLVRPALRAEIGQHYFGEIQYHRFTGGRYNLLVDRDFVSLVAGARF